jgi:hypothetical protein
MAVSKFSLRVESNDAANPIKTGQRLATFQGLLRYFGGLFLGAKHGATLKVESAATYATAGVVFGTTTTGTVGATICAQAITVSASGGTANTAALFAAAVNANTHADIKGIFSATGGGFLTGDTLTGSVTGVAKASASPVLCKALSFDAQSGNFEVDELVTGGTSGATGIVLAQVDAGTSGTLLLGSVTGTWQNNEAITGDVIGAATVDGTASDAVQLTYSNETGAFAAAEVVTSSTNGATGVVLVDVEDAEDDTLGTLYLGTLVGKATVSCLLPGINGMPIAASGTGITITGSATRFAGATKTYAAFSW